MFEIKISHYNKVVPPYKEKVYYCMALGNYVDFSYHLESNLSCQVQKFREFFKKLHKDKKINKWLARFSRKTHETSHKSRHL